MSKSKNDEVQEGPNRAKVLAGYVERVERLNEERSALGADISDIYKEAKSQGFDAKTMREMIKLRKMDAEARAEAEALRDAYMNALDLV